MVDPLAEVVTLLQPGTPYSKVVSAAGRWRIRRTTPGQTFYFLALEGECRLSVEGQPDIDLVPGDFVLIPAAPSFALTSPEPPADEADSVPVQVLQGEFRLGEQTGPAQAQWLVGHCVFGSPDAALLVALLPQMMHVRGVPRLTTLVRLVSDESRAQRPARDVVLARLLEVLLIEALRCTAGPTAAPGLLRGLADPRLAAAIHCLHEHPAQAWTVAQLARHAALSRSAFFQRFSQAMGQPPMAYLLAWRMALAKDLLRRQQGGMAQIAQQVGYSSASAFSVAFTRHVGVAPTRYVPG